MTCDCSCYDDGYDDGREQGVADTLSETAGGTPDHLIGVYVLQYSLYIERGGEYNVIDTRTGEHIETRFRVPEGARRVKYAG